MEAASAGAPGSLRERIQVPIFPDLSLALLLPWAWLQVTAVIRGDGVGRSEPLIRTVERLD